MASIATNKYFNQFNDIPEQRLYDDLINECVQINGIDCIYLPRNSASNVDLLFGEDPTSVFTEGFPCEVYVQSVDNFEGGELFSKFGLEVRKQARFLMTNRSFQRGVGTGSISNYFGSNTAISRPREGDLIWMQNFAALFEIKYADEEYFFYTFGKNNIYGYSLVCEKFRYSNEVISTGIDEVDQAANQIVAAYDFIMANSYASGPYKAGEMVWQGNGASNVWATATMVQWNLPTLTLTLKDIQGTFNVNTAIVGANSNAVFRLISNNLLEQVNPNMDNNTDLANEGVNIINFDASNPFGDVTP